MAPCDFFLFESKNYYGERVLTAERDFVDWIHNDKIDIFTTNCWDIKKCDRLSILVELSIIFAVNNLIEYLIYKIEEKLYFMPPEYVDFTIALDILKNKETKILHSIISCENRDSDNTEKFIHCWDGNDFFELTSFKYPEDIVNCCTDKYKLEGMQIIGRRYNFYLCGGEFGDTGIFNKNVWRYSLIFLRVANDLCNKKKCSHIMKYNSRIEFKLSSSYNKQDSILDLLKKMNCDAYFYKYNYDDNYDEVIRKERISRLAYRLIATEGKMNTQIKEYFGQSFILKEPHHFEISKIIMFIYIISFLNFLYQQILGATCVGIIGNEFSYEFVILYKASVFIFFFIATCTFFINTFILYVSNLISPSAASIIPKTIYEFLYHFIASILLFAASIAVIIVIHEPYVVVKRYNEFLAASILTLLNCILYICNTVMGFSTYGDD
ncbi:hypothetical protein ALC53_03790 [Atta colombica]|uniref:MARVEL domain-containing protein n=1 Tax=Atta colombica TaxID=520822 RepID=A0A195BNC6_9HYME|nr:hypothetical protein ALC53_03790 [Atta colombica]